MTTPGIDRLKEVAEGANSFLNGPAENPLLMFLSEVSPAAVLALLARLAAAEAALRPFVAEFEALQADFPNLSDEAIIGTVVGPLTMADFRAASAYFDTATAPDPDHAGRGE